MFKSLTSFLERRQQSLIKTVRNRPDLLESAQLDKKDIEFLKTLDTENGIE